MAILESTIVECNEEDETDLNTVIYFKKYMANHYYFDKYITSIINNLIVESIKLRRMRDMFGYHVAYIFNFDIKGYNTKRTKRSGITSTHAEVDALSKLPNNDSTKYISIDILIIRINAYGQLVDSKPCKRCVNFMNETIKKRGYRIRHVYYSSNFNNINVINYKYLLNDDNKYICKNDRVVY